MMVLRKESEVRARTAEQTHAAEYLGETLTETLGGCKLTWPSRTRALGDSHVRGVMMEGKEDDVLVVNAFPAHATAVGQGEGTTWTALSRVSLAVSTAVWSPPLWEGPIVLIDWPLASPVVRVSFHHLLLAGTQPRET